MSHETRSSHPGSPPAELERHAFNLAFSELDLCWQWDERTYEELQAHGSERERLLAYVRLRHGHLLKAYEPEFLVDAIRQTMSRCRGDLDCQRPPAR
jgi:hypothetical protein